MAFTNSKLVQYTKISANNNPRTSAITKITPHHMAGNLTIETCGSVFQSRQASSNYGIGSDGRIGMYVEEKNRSWASSSPSNDHAAVTIEVSNSSTGGNWPVSDKAFKSLISLCVDICKRNPGIKQKDGKSGLYFDGTSGASLTTHDMFVATTCPGPYLKSRMQLLAEEVNKQLKENLTEPQQSTSVSSTSPTTLKAGQKLNLKNVKLYVSSSANFVAGNITGTYYLWSAEVVNNRVRVTNSASRVGETGQVTGWISKADITSANASSTSTSSSVFKEYKIRVSISDLRIRSGAGTNFSSKGCIKPGVYTIVAEASGTGAKKWGKLKSGEGWIALDFTTKV